MTEGKPQHFDSMFSRYNDSQQNMTDNGTDLSYDETYLFTNDTNLTKNVRDFVREILGEHKSPKYLFQMELTLALVGVLLNICHGFALIDMRMHKPWKTHSKLIVSLAIADFIIALLHCIQHYESFPTVVSVEINFDLSFTKVFISAVYYIAQFAQMLTMIGFAVNLLIATKMPLNYKRLMSPYRGNILVGCFWIVSGLVVGGVHMFTKILTQLYTALLSCWIIVALIILLSTLTAILLIILYLLSFCEIYKLKRRTPRSLLLKKSALTFFVILLTYIVFLMPGTWLIVLMLSQYFTGSGLHVGILLKVTLTLSCLYVLNTICDPLIYAVQIDDIRDSYKRVYKKLCARWRCREESENV